MVTYSSRSACKATKIKKSFILEIKHLQLITEYILKEREINKRWFLGRLPARLRQRAGLGLSFFLENTIYVDIVSVFKDEQTSFVNRKADGVLRPKVTAKS